MQNYSRMFFAALTLMCSAMTKADNVRIYTTRADGTQRVDYTTTTTTTTYGSNIIRLQPDKTYQAVDGFGYALTYSSCYNLMQMAPMERKALLRRTFSTSNGLGVSYVRISIGCSDFSSTEYTLCDEKGLEHFRLYSDETDYVIPILQEVFAINPDVKVMAAPWTCPRWMKVNNLTDRQPYNHWTSGQLNPAYYQDYADYFVRFVQAFEAAGIPIYAVTPQNEPLNRGNSASLYMTWAEEAAFMEKLAPAFKKAGLKTKIYCFDHNYNYDNKADQNDYPIQLYNALSGNIEGSELIVGSAWHDYGGNVTELDDINQKAPDKEIIFTETSIGTWNDGRNLGKRLMTDMENLIYQTLTRQCKAVMVWNMMLDYSRGPNRDGGCTTCYGALDIDENDYHTLSANSHYYVIAHSSAVVRPGAVRIGTRGQAINGISQMAFHNPDGSYGIVLFNKGTSAKKISILENTDAVASVNVPANSVVSVMLGGEADKVPSWDGVPMTRTELGVYTTTAKLKQDNLYAQDFLAEGWYVDPDFLALTEDGKLRLLPIDGTYILTVDVNARTLIVKPEENHLNEQGQGVLYANAVAGSARKPCTYPGSTWLSENAMPMAEMVDGVYQLTLTVGQQMAEKGVDIAFFTSPGMTVPFLNTASAYHIELATDNAVPSFTVGNGSNSRADGHLTLRNSFLRLQEGKTYVVTVDLRGGIGAATVGVHMQGTEDAIRPILSASVPHNGGMYSLDGSKLSEEPDRGLFVKNGKVMLEY